MKNKSSIGLLAGILLLSSSGLAARAQSIYINPGLGIHLGLRHPAREMAMRQADFDRRVMHLRHEIGFNLDRGLISGERAARLNARLDDLAARERDMAASGMLNGDELSAMEARLDNVESAARGSSFF